MPVFYCFIAKPPQDYGLKIIYYYSQQFDYSLQSTYWNSAAIVMYSKMELREEIGWCRRGWHSRSGLLQEQVDSLHILLRPPSLLSMFSDPVTPSYNARSRATDSVLWTWTPRLPELWDINQFHFYLNDPISGIPLWHQNAAKIWYFIVLRVYWDLLGLLYYSELSSQGQVCVEVCHF